MKQLLLLTAVALCLAFTATAQLRVDVSLVNVVATVTDQRGRYVSDLGPEDFILEEDGRRQEISHFSRSNDLPVSVGIVLDTSASMERKIGTATRAVDRFIRNIHSDDDIFFMTFDDTPRVRQDFTSDRDKLSTALYKTKLGSGTALYDGLIAGLDKLKKGKHNKKAILLISDGYDTSSEYDSEVALLVTRESEVLVYCLGIAPDGSLRPPLSEEAPPRQIPGSPGQTGPRIPVPLPGGGTFPMPLPGPGRRVAAHSMLPQGGRTMPSMDAIDMKVLDAFAKASGGNSWLITTTSRQARSRTHSTKSPTNYEINTPSAIIPATS